MLLEFIILLLNALICYATELAAPQDRPFIHFEHLSRSRPSIPSSSSSSILETIYQDAEESKQLKSLLKEINGNHHILTLGLTLYSYDLI